MHAYATNAKDREFIFQLLAVIAVIAAFLLNSLIQVFKLPIPWFIDTPAVASFYAIFLWLYNGYLWSKKLGPMPFSQIPDIRGTWAGKIHSSFHNIEIEVAVCIKQSWLKLSVKLETDTSVSFTTMAAFNVDAGGDSGLKYEYRNEGKVYGLTPDHRGTGHIYLLPDCKTLEGKYYTSEGSNNTGTIVLKLISRELLSRADALEQARQRHFI